MEDQWGLGLRFIFVTIFLVATTNTCLGARNTTMACFEHERLALLKFKHSVIDDYDMLSSWVGNECCSWERVTCDGVTGNVVSLSFRGGYSYLVSKELDTSLRELSHLKYLDLSWNDFQRSRIPKFIGSLRQLTYLNLSYGNFSGIIPHQIGNISNLVTLDLTGDYISDLVADDMIWIFGLSSLEHLDLSYANLSRAKNLDMVLYMIPSIKVLRLQDCYLLIDDLDALNNSSTSLSNIRNLDLRYNSLKGQLPHFFYNMSTLQILDLTGVPLSFASNFANLLSMFPSLLELHLQSCNVEKTSLSHILHNTTILSNIKYLDLSWNELTGSIPAFLEKLSELYLSGNYLNGSIPEFCGRLCYLTKLDLSYNQLTGIPVSIGQLFKLRSLDVSHNPLEGVVSESHFSNLSMLKDLNLAYNSRLTFNVSREWLPPFLLTSIDLSSCKIESKFPQWIRSQRKLRQLYLSNATLFGPLPTWLRNMPIIPFIDLSHNNLSGPLSNLPSMGTNIDDDWERRQPKLYLQNNIFNESIPRSLCMRTDLVFLDLSSNMLTGIIPECLENLKKLRFMILSSNKLYGVIPSFIGNFSSLLSLNLNDNKFSGELPAELWNLNKLYLLDLGDNAFCGKLPDWIGDKFESLIVFRLHNNNFTGGIPRSLCKIIVLQILDIAHNEFTGTIPHCLGELQGMARDRHDSLVFGSRIEEGLTQVLKGNSLEYTMSTWSLLTNIDLSRNKLVGNIPIELTALLGLMGLNLSNNHLSGSIPEKIGNMTGLNSLDLSGNKLDGSIPPSIAALNFLSHLNLSNNNLSGRIPTGNQLQTLIDPSIYAGNKGLCGEPLPNNCSIQEDPTVIAKNKYETTHEPNKVWFYVDITCGFATGFWGIIVVLLLKKQWRDKLFLFAEAAMDKMHVAVMVRVNKMKRVRGAI